MVISFLIQNVLFYGSLGISVPNFPYYFLFFNMSYGVSEKIVIIACI